MRLVLAVPCAVLASLALPGAPRAAASQSTQALHWAPNARSQAFDAAFTGPALVSLLTGAPGGPGIVIRRCYGIDQTQGGRNQTAGSTEVPWLRWMQAGSPTIDIGLVSVQSSVVDSLAGDACFSPLFAAFQPGAQRAKVGLALVVGSLPALPPFPAGWNIAFDLTGSTVSVPNTFGADSGAAFPGSPLLATVIYEVQGPLPSLPANVQYYLASTSERPSALASAPGGIADGNALLASGLFGAGPTVTNAIAHTRLAAFGPTGAVTAPLFSIGAPGDTELHGALAFATPALWASADGNDGTGGPDWNVSGVGGPVSLVNLRLLDLLAGAQSNPASPDFEPGLAVNRAAFLWSGTDAVSMSQRPFTWDDTYGQPRPGDQTLGALPTQRDPGQTLPLVADTVTLVLLGEAALTLGKPFTPAGGAGPPIAELF
ncbi:MAG TPA: hypothetical protein VJP77_01855, partial [Planctomycetota bacterium]|nr:hypothetical protein [Planctomycetota bacterium]